MALLASWREQHNQRSSACICGSGSYLCAFPPQSRIVLPFENPPDVLRALGRLGHGVPPGIQERLRGLPLDCSFAWAGGTCGLTCCLVRFFMAAAPSIAYGATLVLHASYTLPRARFAEQRMQTFLPSSPVFVKLTVTFCQSAKLPSG